MNNILPCLPVQDVATLEPRAPDWRYEMRISILVALGVLGALCMPAAADGDAEKGEQVFKRCVACHMVGENAKNRVGPSLNGVIDQEIASVDGFQYSKAFITKKEEGFVWTRDTLDEYLKQPTKMIKGTKMAFAGLPKEEDRENVIAYLATFE